MEKVFLRRSPLDPGGGTNPMSSANTDVMSLTGSSVTIRHKRADHLVTFNDVSQLYDDHRRGIAKVEVIPLSDCENHVDL